jgi:uncharacterized protein YihD (DUF1040 family)
MLHEFWVLVGSPSYISGITLLGLLVKFANDIYTKRSMSRLDDEILVLHLKIRELEIKLEEKTNEDSKES